MNKHSNASEPVDSQALAKTREEQPLQINAVQLRAALEFVAPDFDTEEDQRECEVVIQRLPARISTDGEPMEAGLYCWLAEYPEEGCIPLREDESFPVARPSAATPAAPAKNLITIDMDALARAIYSNTDASEQEARSIINTVGFAAPAPAPEAVAWEAASERYLADIIDRAPEPLRRLGEWLSHQLDEDQWKTAERYVLGAMESIATPTPGDSVDAPVQQAGELTDAARDVLGERQRQISAEGWTPEHDDEHDDGRMAVAAAYYATYDLKGKGKGWGRVLWPWDEEWCKPKDDRSNLVRAGALVIAEIERIDRAALKGKQPEDRKDGAA